ncbi:peptidase family C78-domain-containing protein [Syncephalastrum racemosum]|uniref:Peptidase family C78-domain-containing protein n=1 Tax=Syncephalastrum racemosum TaxID=13706 RepID=A0A1X2H7W1_SYNRA|nr:peptidase family C78-domain-containing protein [Syncephalastrum racemosum]
MTDSLSDPNTPRPLPYADSPDPPLHPDSIKQQTDPVNSTSSRRRSSADDPSRSLKRKEPAQNGNEEQHEHKRHQGTRVYARTKINTDQELWSLLTALKENSRTAGVIPRLEPHFTKLNRKGNTVAAYLCSPFTDHIATGFLDLGWGCGYRNCQMLMTFLQRKREAGELILKQVADISGLQLLLERAWQEGFDPQGAAQLDHHVYKTRKWIGTTEVYCMLTYLGIRSTILDFHRPSPNNTHDTMFDWIQSYFEDGKTHTKKNHVVHITDRPPLYLQHSGHSRTVIGIELLNDGKRNLIMFDPGRRMLRSYRNSTPPKTTAEDDMEESGLSSSATGDDDDDDDEVDEQENAQDNENEQPSAGDHSFASRLLARWTNHAPLPANLLRPFRVDAKTIAKNKQYQLLVLGQVTDERSQGGQLAWNPSKGFLLDEDERLAMKDVTSLQGL